MNYKEGYDWGKQSLETAGVSEAELDARLLLEKICGTDRNTLLVHGDRLLSEEEKAMVLPAGDDTFVYEMMAGNADGTASIGVVVEKSELSPEEYMEIMKEQLQGDNMEGMAFQVVQNITDREFLGRPVKYMQVDSSYQKVIVRHTYMIYAQDGYLVEMIGTGVPESPEVLEALMASFTTLE